jgi:hypothetical protein
VTLTAPDVVEHEPFRPRTLEIHFDYYAADQVEEKTFFWPFGGSTAGVLRSVVI